MSQNVCGGCGALLGNQHSKTCKNYNPEAPLFWGEGGVPAEQYAASKQAPESEETPGIEPGIAFFEEFPFGEDPGPGVQGERPADMHPLAEPIQLPEDPELRQIVLEVHGEVKALRMMMEVIHSRPICEVPKLMAAVPSPTYMLVYPLPPKAEAGEVAAPPASEPPVMIETVSGNYNVILPENVETFPTRTTEEMVPLDVLVRELDKMLETALQRGDNRNQLNLFRQLVTSNTVKGVRIE